MITMELANKKTVRIKPIKDVLCKQLIHESLINE